MACLACLLPRLRLYAARHLSRLAPLLLEWLLAPDEATRRAAAGCWEGVLRCCWPRAGAHAAVVWQHLVAASRAVDSGDWRVGGGKGDEGKATGDGEAACEFVELGGLLIAIAGQEAVLGAAAGSGEGGEGEKAAAAAAGGEGPGRCEAALLALLS
jgi:hypothetical protein